MALYSQELLKCRTMGSAWPSRVQGFTDGAMFPRPHFGSQDPRFGVLPVRIGSARGPVLGCGTRGIPPQEMSWDSCISRLCLAA